MFTPKLSTPRSKYSSHSINRNSRDQRNVGIFGNQPITPSRSLNRSALQTSHILEETTQHQLEEFGGPLPVLVTETITLAERNAIPSFSLDPSGYAWLVCGRRLLIWKYKSQPNTKSGYCRELVLPPSELIHTSDLVSILLSHDGSQISVVGASPEGVVRYWPSINQEGAFAEISIEMHGEESGKLIAVEPFHCILSTRNSALILLSPVPNQMTIHSKALRIPQGMLSGVGRRMSSFFFGGGAEQQAGSPLKQLIQGENSPDNSQAFYVLTQKHLQKWTVNRGYEKFVYQIEIKKLLQEDISQAVWGQNADQLGSLKVWVIDIQMTRDGIVLFGAGMNSEVSSDIHYVLGTLHTEGEIAPKSFISFTVSKFSNIYQEETKRAALSYRLLLPDPSVSSIYIHDLNNIICLSVSSSADYDKVDFQAPRDRIIGGGCTDRQAVFFSVNHGLVSMKESRQSNMSVTEHFNGSAMFSDSINRLEMSADLTKANELSMCEDKTKKLKAAFLYQCSGSLAECQGLLDELFPENVGVSKEPGSPFDNLIVQLSQEIIDDYPASDPRWADAMPNDVSSSSGSLILLHQLEDKLKAHEYYINFLKATELWSRLSSVKDDNRIISTHLLLSEHAEKVMAALALRTQHVKFPDLVDLAIKEVLKHRGEMPRAGLTEQDLFYREVSRVHEIIIALVLYEDEYITEKSLPSELFRVVSAVNSIVSNMLHDAWDYRQSKSAVYQASDLSNVGEYVPWTASVAAQGMRAMLIKQHTLTVERALSVAKDSQQRGLLYQQLLDMTDLILDGYRCQLESQRQVSGETPHYQEVLRQYEKHRTQLILPFMQQEQYQRAASLAEKYCDFELLVQLCEATGNQERLQRYMTQFHHQGFSDFVFQWYVGEGKRGKLMSSSMATHPQLGKFLQTSDNKFMSWVHDLHAGDYRQASDILADLANTEAQSLSKKKTLLSLSKLSALADSDPSPDFQEKMNGLNDAQDLILHQEMLPQEVIDSLGLDADNMQVFSPKELIELYVGNQNTNANEIDFRKALDLLPYMNQTAEGEAQTILLHIWCQALMRNDWNEISSDEPLENCKDTVFFKTVQLAISEGLDLNEFLPTADALLAAEELGNLRTSANFQYLVKAGYEYIQRLMT